MKKIIISMAFLIISFTVFATYWDPYNASHAQIMAQPLGVGQIIYDIQGGTIRMGDGTTPGGIPVGTTADSGIASTDTGIVVDTGATPAGYVNMTINDNSYKVMIAIPSGN